MEREVHFFMRRNAIIKMVVSAAAAAYVAVMPVQAEENGEETLIKECGSACPDPQPLGSGQTAEGNASRENGPGGSTVYDSEENEDTEPDFGALAVGEDCLEDETREEVDAGDGDAGAGGEAQYSAMGQILEGHIMSTISEQSQLEELIKKTGYGPHLLLYMKELEEKEEEAKAEPEALAYSEEDLYVLAHAICGEGQGYPDDEQLYIGSVILNRRAHGAYPDTIKDVVFQRGQYACTRDGNYYREPTQANWRNARWLLENGSILPPNVVYQAGFRQGSGLYAQTRYHKYCYR